MTDFNIATRLAKDGLACSMSGTKPYMAPEVFMCALDEVGKCRCSIGVVMALMAIHEWLSKSGCVCV